MVSIGHALGVGWEAFKRYPWLAIGAFLIYEIAGQVSSFAAAFAVPPLFGGLLIFTLKMLSDDKPRIDDLFVGFHRYWDWMGTYWLMAAIALGAVLVSALAMGVPVGLVYLLLQAVGGALSEPFAAVLTAAWIVGLIVLSSLLMVPWSFALFATAEGAGVSESFRRSVELTRGLRWPIFWAHLAVTLVAISGALLCGIGMLATVPVSYAMWAAIYLDLKGPSVQPAPVSPNAVQP